MIYQEMEDRDHASSVNEFAIFFLSQEFATILLVTISLMVASLWMEFLRTV